MIGRETDGAGIGGDVGNEHRLRGLDQLAEHPVPLGDWADCRPLFGRDAGGNEFDDLALRVGDAEGGVARRYDLPREIDQALQDDRQIDFGGNREGSLVGSEAEWFTGVRVIRHAGGADRIGRMMGSPCHCLESR